MCSRFVRLQACDHMANPPPIPEKMVIGLPENKARLHDFRADVRTPDLGTRYARRTPYRVNGRHVAGPMTVESARSRHRRHPRRTPGRPISFAGNRPEQPSRPRRFTTPRASRYAPPCLTAATRRHRWDSGRQSCSLFLGPLRGSFRDRCRKARPSSHQGSCSTPDAVPRRRASSITPTSFTVISPITTLIPPRRPRHEMVLAASASAPGSRCGPRTAQRRRHRRTRAARSWRQGQSGAQEPAGG